MSDLISRKEVLDMLFKMRENKNGDDHYRIGVSNAINAVKFAPSIKPETREWISVKDRLPISRKVVITCDRYDNMNRASCIAGEFYHYDDEGYRNYLRGVTHWMPLPEPPEGENE